MPWYYYLHASIFHVCKHDMKIIDVGSGLWGEHAFQGRLELAHRGQYTTWGRISVKSWFMKYVRSCFILRYPFCMLQICMSPSFCPVQPRSSLVVQGQSCLKYPKWDWWNSYGGGEHHACMIWEEEKPDSDAISELVQFRKAFHLPYGPARIY